MKRKKKTTNTGIHLKTDANSWSKGKVLLIIIRKKRKKKVHRTSTCAKFELND